MDRTQVQIYKKGLLFRTLCTNTFVKVNVKEGIYWVHPLNNTRYLNRAFNTILIDLREDEQKFFNYFRMSIRSFDELASRISDALKGQERTADRTDAASHVQCRITNCVLVKRWG